MKESELITKVFDNQVDFNDPQIRTQTMFYVLDFSRYYPDIMIFRTREEAHEASDKCPEVCIVEGIVDWKGEDESE